MGKRRVGTVVKELRVSCDGVEFFKVPVRFDHDENHFLVDIDTPFTINLTNKDINALEKAVQEQLKEAYATKWDAMLHVEVKVASNGNYSGRSLSIEYEPFEITTRKDGKKMHRRPNQRSPWDGWPAEGVTKNNDDLVESQSLIEDTPENRAAIERIFDAMEKLGERVGNMMSPKHIMTTLLQTCSVLVLAAPEEVKKQTHRANSADIEI